MTKTITTPPQEHTVRQVAEIVFGEATGATIKAVQRMIAAGKFPNAHQVHGGPNLPFLIPEPDVAAYLHTRKASRPPK